MKLETPLAAGLLAAMCGRPYNDLFSVHKMTNQSRQARKYRTYSTYGCAVCGKSYVTLVKRDGVRFCRDCAASIDDDLLNQALEDVAYLEATGSKTRRN